MVNVYAPNKKASKYEMQNVLKPKRETDKSTIIVRHFNTLFST